MAVLKESLAPQSSSVLESAPLPSGGSTPGTAGIHPPPPRPHAAVTGEGAREQMGIEVPPGNFSHKETTPGSLCLK